jgi:hypothetical protein
MSAGELCGNGTPAIGPNNQLTDTGALFGEDVIGSTTQVPDGDMAGWELDAPAGTTITRVSFYASYSATADGWLAGLLVDGQPATYCAENLQHTDPCTVLNNQLPHVQSGLSASKIFFGAVCSQPGGGGTCTPNAITSHAAQADLYSAQVTLSEAGGPNVQSEGGPLWSTGPVWGTAALTFNATDPSGIQQVQLQTSRGGTRTVSESCDFTQAQPCPELPSGQLQVDTTSLADGPQSVQLQLTNAAGNTTVVQGPTVIIDNNGPPAPTSLTAVAASTTSTAIDLAWSDPLNPPEPVQNAYAQLCQSTCLAPVQIHTGGAAQITAPAAGTYTIRLWMTDTAGRGSSANAATTTVTVPAPTTTPKPCAPPSKCPVFKLRSAHWARGRLTVAINRLPKGDQLQLTLFYARHRPRTITTTRTRVTITTIRPKKVILQALRHGRRHGGPITVTKL